MRTHDRDDKVLLIRTPRDALALPRRGWLARTFNPDFDAAIIPFPPKDILGEDMASVAPFLEEMLYTGNDETEIVIHAIVTNGFFSPHDIMMSEQLISRHVQRRLVSRPQSLFKNTGMCREFGAIFGMVSGFAAYNRPAIGKNIAISILNKPGYDSEEKDMHRDIESDEADKDIRASEEFFVTNMPLLQQHPATVIRGQDGEMIRPPNGSPVFLKGKRLHATPCFGEFRPIICARPTLF